jgi:hypothetical protein
VCGLLSVLAYILVFKGELIPQKFYAVWENGISNTSDAVRVVLTKKEHKKK